MDKRLKLEKNRLIAAIIVFLYFCFILCIYYLKLEAQIVRIIGELLTIPALLTLLGLPIWALIDNFKQKNKKQLIYILTLLVSLITMAMLLIANSYFK